MQPYLLRLKGINALLPEKLSGQWKKRVEGWGYPRRG